MPELQRLRCAKCGEYYWAEERHRCRSRGALVPVRLRRPRVEVEFQSPPPGPVRPTPRPLPEPGADARNQPALLDPAVVERRLRELESEIEVLKQASDRLRGNDSQYEQALELLVAEVVQLKTRRNQADAAERAAAPAPADRPERAERKLRRRPRPPSPPRRHTAAFMMWWFFVAAVAAAWVLAKMLG
jgi:hypothetical protein